MNVCDVGQLLRGTLRAAQNLQHFRGLEHASRRDACDLRPWLARAALLEELPDELFQSAARAFLACVLQHANKKERDDAAAQKQAERCADEPGENAPTKRKRARKRGQATDNVEQQELARAIEHTTGAHQLVRSAKQVHVFDRLSAAASAFVPHVQALVFERASDAEPVHATARELLALLVHSGINAKQINASLDEALARMETLRDARAEELRYNTDQRLDLPCLLQFVVWGATYRHGAAGHARVRNKLRNAQRQWRGRLRIELLTAAELQYNVAEHVLLPVFDIVHNPSQCRDLRTSKPHELRYMRESDPQARVRGLRAGQVVRVTRSDMALGGVGHSYLIVVTDALRMPSPYKWLDYNDWQSLLSDVDAPSSAAQPEVADNEDSGSE